MITEATQSDLPLLNALVQEVQELHHQLYPKKFKPAAETDMSSVLKGFFDDEHSHIILVHSDEKVPVGYLIYENKLHRETEYSYEYRCLYVHHLTISQSQRGKGYGKKLIQYVQEQAREAGIDCIELDVWTANADSKQFFEKLGFRTFHEKMTMEL